jgi:hypothetical protein
MGRHSRVLNHAALSMGKSAVCPSALAVIRCHRGDPGPCQASCVSRLLLARAPGRGPSVHRGWVCRPCHDRHVAIHPIEAVLFLDEKVGGFQGVEVVTEVAQFPVGFLGQHFQGYAPPGLHEGTFPYFQSDRAIVSGHCEGELYRRFRCLARSVVIKDSHAFIGAIRHGQTSIRQLRLHRRHQPAG